VREGMIRCETVKKGTRPIRLFEGKRRLWRGFGDPGSWERLAGKVAAALRDGAEIVVDISCLRDIRPEGIRALGEMRGACAQQRRFLKIVAQKKVHRDLRDNFLVYRSKKEALESFIEHAGNELLVCD
jgi:hypothetical protein